MVVIVQNVVTYHLGTALEFAVPHAHMSTQVYSVQIESPLMTFLIALLYHQSPRERLCGCFSGHIAEMIEGCEFSRLPIFLFCLRLSQQCSLQLYRRGSFVAVIKSQRSEICGESANRIIDLIIWLILYLSTPEG